MTRDLRGPWPTALKYLVVITLVMLFVQIALNQPLMTPYAPQGILSFELAATAEVARLILDSWPGQGWIIAALLSGLLLMATYTATMFLLARYLLRDRPGVREQKFGYWVKRLFICAGVANCADKVVLLGNLDSPTDSLSLTATILVLISYTGFLLGTAGLVVIRASRRRPLVPSQPESE